MSSGERGKRPVRVTIFNQSYNLLANGEPGLTESLAQYVDELMNNIAQKIGGTDSTRVAVLAGLHLADRAKTLEREIERMQKRIAEMNERCAGLIDAALDNGDGTTRPAAKAADTKGD